MDRIELLKATAGALAVMFVVVAAASVFTLRRKLLGPRLQLTAGVLAGVLSMLDTIRGLEGGGWFTYALGGMWAGVTVLWVLNWDQGRRIRRYLARTDEWQRAWL